MMCTGYLFQRHMILSNCMGPLSTSLDSFFVFPQPLIGDSRACIAFKLRNQSHHHVIAGASHLQWAAGREVS